MHERARREQWRLASGLGRSAPYDTTPTANPSGIQMDALKKLTLVQLISYSKVLAGLWEGGWRGVDAGQVWPMPKCTHPTSTTRLKSFLYGACMRASLTCFGCSCHDATGFDALIMFCLDLPFRGVRTWNAVLG